MYNLDFPIFGVSQEEKEARLLKAANELTEFHYKNCPEYKQIINVIYDGPTESKALSELPYLHVGLFKKHELYSVPKCNIIKTMYSSGTTGQAQSKIFIDSETATIQSKVLIKIVSSVLGNKRMPMIVIDTADILKKKEFTARAAGIVGMMNFGSKPFFALNEDMKLNIDGLKDFLKNNGKSQFFMFGFTYMVWCYFYEQIMDLELDLSNGILIHSGGWKKMLEKKVDNEIFKSSFKAASNLYRIYNFYGMIEQTGGIFLEDDDGLLYPSAVSDIIIRDPITLEDVGIDKEGLIQVISPITHSYPGHSILTEDYGIIRHINYSNKGRKGKGFSVLGRLPKAELRGCSNTFEAAG